METEKITNGIAVNNLTMIKFFRQIRLNLLSENKEGKPVSPVGRYMLYAVGEIVLVVIGILIALGINDWNETKKNTLIEYKYLTSMLEDFENNLQKSKDIIIAIEEILPHLTGLLEQSSLEKPSISVDSINMAFAKINSMPSYSSTDRIYNNLMGSGDLKLIKSDELKTNLSKYYKFLYILNMVQNTHELELVQSFQPYIIEYLDFQAVKPLGVDDFKLPDAVEENKILEVFKTRKFRNILTLKWAILTDLLDQNRNLEQINMDIVDQLKTLTNK